MLLSVVADVASPSLFVEYGEPAVALIVLIVLVEGVILWRLQWAGLGRSLAAALVANVVSGAVGLIFLVYEVSSVVVVLAISFLLSIAIEAGILMLFKRHARRENWRAALIANFAGYLLIALAFVWLA